MGQFSSALLKFISGVELVRDPHSILQAHLHIHTSQTLVSALPVAEVIVLHSYVVYKSYMHTRQVNFFKEQIEETLFNGATVFRNSQMIDCIRKQNFMLFNYIQLDEPVTQLTVCWIGRFVANKFIMYYHFKTRCYT